MKINNNPLIGHQIDANFIQYCAGPQIVSALQNTKQNFSSELCPDDIVGEISFSNNTFNLGTNKIRQNISSTSVIDYSKPYNDDYVIIIIESPHYWEFDKLFRYALGPAQGRTGENIDFYLEDVMNDLFANKLNEYKVLSNYKIALLNAVQYQCSAGLHPIHKSIRDFNFNTYWNNGFSDDLVKRINHLNVNNNSIILNCVTSNLQNIVKTKLTSAMPNSLVFESFHPSVWNYKKYRRIK